MVEVKPTAEAQLDSSAKNIGQVVLKRLISADQVIDLLCTADLSANGKLGARSEWVKGEERGVVE